MRRFDDVLCLGHFCSRPMRDQKELICFECCFVLHNAVLRDSYAVEASPQSPQYSYHYRTFQRSHDPCHQRSRH